MNTENSTNTKDNLHFADTTLRTQDEAAQTPQKEPDSVTVGDPVDDLQSNSDGAAGTDRAGTAERKTYGDTQLNKGLEAQAKDEEGSI